LRKALDHQLEIEHMHTFQVRKSFIFNIKERTEADEEEKSRMYKWLLTKMEHKEV